MCSLCGMKQRLSELRTIWDDESGKLHGHFVGMDILRKVEDLRDVHLSQGRESEHYGKTFLSFCFCSSDGVKKPLISVRRTSFF